VIANSFRRKPIEEILRDRGILACDLLEALPAAVYLTDADGHLTFYNRAAADLWGWHPELGSARWCGSWRLFWPDGAQLPHDQCPMAVAIKQNRQVRGVTAQAERPDGARVPFRPYPTPLRDRGGDLIGAINLLVTIRDHCNYKSVRHRPLDAQQARKKAECQANNLLMAVLPVASMLHEDGAVLRRHPKGLVEALALRLVDESGLDTWLSPPAAARARLAEPPLRRATGLGDGLRTEDLGPSAAKYRLLRSARRRPC
jgi:PAS fold